MKKVRPIPILSLIVFLIGILSAIVHFMMNRSPQFADKINSSASHIYRMTTSFVTSFIPFSFAEFLLFASPLLLIALCVIMCRYSAGGKLYFIRAICLLICIPMLVYSMFVFGLAPGYRGTSLDKKLEIDREKVSADDLYHTSMIVLTELNRISREIKYSVDGASVMPYDIDEMNEKLIEAYETVNSEYSLIKTFRAKTKPLIISKYMTYTHLSGMYTYFTGEANINTNYPDFVVAYTAAHEMAHQRGISKEDEANFLAFLVCKSSDDLYLQYAAYLNMYEYLTDALYQADRTLYASAFYSLNSNVRNDIIAYSDFFDQYRENKAADVSEKINNDYLISQGTEGTKSYGMVVDLAVAYYKK